MSRLVYRQHSGRANEIATSHMRCPSRRVASCVLKQAACDMQTKPGSTRPHSHRPFVRTARSAYRQGPGSAAGTRVLRPIDHPANVSLDAACAIDHATCPIFPKRIGNRPALFKKNEKSGQRAFHYGGHQNSPRPFSSRENISPTSASPPSRRVCLHVAQPVQADEGRIRRRAEHEECSGSRRGPPACPPQVVAPMALVAPWRSSGCQRAFGYAPRCGNFHQTDALRCWRVKGECGVILMDPYKGTDMGRNMTGHYRPIKRSKDAER
jgi:hypothetical protein